ncbi:MAG: nuclear transport factor 2 family protein [Deltaproteobacteria bacterium]|nr:nuclear transport factor 2 family protein [Deltaproteobacteria bacterium]
MKQISITITLFLGFIAHASTQGTWQRHISAWNTRDLGAIVADYSETAHIILNNRVYRGKTQIRSLFQKLFGLFDMKADYPEQRCNWQCGEPSGCDPDNCFEMR